MMHSLLDVRPQGFASQEDAIESQYAPPSYARTVRVDHARLRSVKMHAIRITVGCA